MSEQNNNNNQRGEILHEWTVQEYNKHERGAVWYAVITALGLLLVIYALATGNFLFALIIILFAIIMFLQHHQEPSQVLFQITDLGVTVGRKFYVYSEFEDFYIIYNPPEVKTLYLNPKNALRPLLRVPLLDINPVEIKHCLREFLPEDLEKEEEPLSDRAARNWQIH